MLVWGYLLTVKEQGYNNTSNILQWLEIHFLVSAVNFFPTIKSAWLCSILVCTIFQRGFWKQWNGLKKHFRYNITKIWLHEIARIGVAYYGTVSGVILWVKCPVEFRWYTLTYVGTCKSNNTLRVVRASIMDVFIIMYVSYFPPCRLSCKSLKTAFPEGYNKLLCFLVSLQSSQYPQKLP